MDVIQLTRELVDIPSITEDEEAVGRYVFDYLKRLADAFRGRVERLEVSLNRYNIFAQWGEAPTVTFSTHMDTVPPFFPSQEDEDFVYGRGSCDAKGILAAMLVAVDNLLVADVRNLGVLALVGEERGSAGAIAAANVDRGARYLINGEPTENKLALGTKGALRYELKATGRPAHSAYPELGESAIEKLLDALQKIRALSLPTDRILGASTMNIGTINGGSAPNVIPAEAKAELLIRLVDDGKSTRRDLQEAVNGLLEVEEILYIEAKLLENRSGFATTTVAYTSDIPLLGDNWGKPFLMGPGSIHAAHTDHERVPKSELLVAVRLYEKLARQLLKEVTE